jgi:hypothetical protein
MNMIKISPALEVSAFKILNTKTCVLSDNSLKNLSFVICEELLSNGIPFCVVDEEGVFKNLRIKYQILWIGDETSDVEMHYCDFKKLAEKAIDKSLPVILDVSKIEKPDRYLEEFFSELINAATNHRRPYLLVIDNAEKYLPEAELGIRTLREIALMRSGRGLGLVVLSGKPSLLDRNVLNYCSNQIIGHLVREEDLKSVGLFFTEEDKVDLKALGNNEFVVRGGFESVVNIHPRKRYINHKAIKTHFPFTSVKMKEMAPDLRRERIIESERVLERISKEESKGLVRLKRKYLLFGDEVEDFKSITKMFKRVVQVRVDEGGKQLNLLFDANTSLPYDYDNTLRVREEFGQFAGLTNDEARVMAIVSSESMCTAQFLKDRTGMKHHELSDVVAELMKKGKLVRFESEGGSGLLRTSSEFPAVAGLHALQAEIVGDTESSTEKVELDEKPIVNLIKVISPQATIANIKVLFYPFYKVEIASLKPRTVIVDAVTGIKI